MILAQSLAASFSFQPTELLSQALTGIESLGVWGGVAFIGLYIVAAIACLPGSILTLGAGAVFGLVWGTVYVFVGATLGSVAAFLMGRYLVRGKVTQILANKPNFAAIDQAVAQEGFKIVVLTRLSPVFPFNLLNYAFGITGVALKDYTLGAIGMIPGILLYVYIGSLAGTLARLGTTPPAPNPLLEWSIRILGLLATLAVTLFVTRLARKALAETVN